MGDNLGIQGAAIICLNVNVAQRLLSNSEPKTVVVYSTGLSQRISGLKIPMLSQMFTPKLFYRSGFNVTNATDGHAINLQMEIIGCDNYDLDESKSMLLKFI